MDVRDVHIGAMLDQGLDRLHEATEGREVDGGLLPAVRLHIRAARAGLQQHPDHVRVAPLRGEVQRRRALIVLHIQALCALLGHAVHQILHHFNFSGTRGGAEHADAAVAEAAQVSAGLHDAINELHAAGLRCVVQRSEPLDVRRVHVRAEGQQDLGHLHVSEVAAQHEAAHVEHRVRALQQQVIDRDAQILLLVRLLPARRRIQPLALGLAEAGLHHSCVPGLQGLQEPVHELLLNPAVRISLSADHYVVLDVSEAAALLAAGLEGVESADDSVAPAHVRRRARLSVPAVDHRRSL
mmetsp:Transcript_11803/g.43963  ORF Transcript_11803/g.43963 Transcript_11803/m.43963 type:complete len:297 (+) Transcript_11803:493-1383(+)